MRAGTARRARAHRPPWPDPLHFRPGPPHEPRRRVPPRRQRLCALRAPQRARAQLTFNNNGIGTYTEQRRLRVFGRPFPVAQSKHVGRAVDFQDHPNRKPAVLTATAPPTTRPQVTTTPSPSSTHVTQHNPAMLTRSVVQQRDAFAVKLFRRAQFTGQDVGADQSQAGAHAAER